jgi:hypothetical protein
MIKMVCFDYVYMLLIKSLSFFSFLVSGDYINMIKKIPLSKSNYEKGRVLEVITFLLFQRALIDLYQLCDRHNLSMFHKLQMNYVTLITDQHTMNCLILKNFITVSFAKASEANKTPCMITTTKSASGKPVATFMMNTGIALHRWRDILLQSLITLLYCSEQLRDMTQYKQVLGWLLLYPLEQFGGVLTFSPKDLLIRWINTLLVENKDASNEPAAAVLVKELLQPVARANGNGESAPIPPFLLVSESFFQFSFFPNNENAENISRSFQRGYQMIDEEKFPVKVITVDCSRKGNTIMMQLTSTLSKAVSCQSISFIFKKIHAESFRFNTKGGSKGTSNGSSNGNNVLSASTPSTPTPPTTTPITSNGHKHITSLTDIDTDEFICTPLSEYQDPVSRLFVIRPGKQEWKCHFNPSSLGEYAFDRSIVQIHYLQLYSKPLYHQLIHPTDFSIKDIHYVEQFVSLEHGSVAQYFQRYPLIKIQSTKSFVQSYIHTTASSPPQQKDDIWITMRFQEPISLDSLSLKVYSQKDDEDVSGKYKKFASNLPGNGGGSGNQQVTVLRELKRTVSSLNFNVMSHNNITSSYFETNVTPSGTTDLAVVLPSDTRNQNPSFAIPLGGADIHFASPINAPNDWMIRKIVSDENQTSSEKSSSVPILLHDSYMHDGGKYIQLQQVGEITELKFRVKYSSLPKTVLTSLQRELWTPLHLMMDGNLQCGHCQIPFQIQSTELISVSNLLTVTTKSPCIIAYQDGIQSLLIQCSLQNHTKSKLILCGYSVITFSDTPAKRVTHLECFKSPKQLTYYHMHQSTPSFPFQETIELAEEVVYHAGFGIKARGKKPIYI